MNNLTLQKAQILYLCEKPAGNIADVPIPSQVVALEHLKKIHNDSELSELDKIIFYDFNSQVYEESYEVIFLTRNGVIMHNAVNHCSCCGFEDQWNPKKVSWNYAKFQINEENLLPSLSEFIVLSLCKEDKMKQVTARFWIKRNPDFWESIAGEMIEKDRWDVSVFQLLLEQGEESETEHLNG